MAGVLSLFSVYFIFASQTIVFTIHVQWCILETRCEPRNVYSFIIKPCSASLLSAALSSPHACTVCWWAREKGEMPKRIYRQNAEKVPVFSPGSWTVRGRVNCLQSWDQCVRGKVSNDLYCILLKIWIFIQNYYRPYLYVNGEMLEINEYIVYIF